MKFSRAAPDAARVLDAAELRAWGELGRRLAMADAETGVAFFAAGVAELQEMPRGARPPLFQVCMRQLQLSTSIALETFRRAPELARAVADAELLSTVYEIALEIARRSAKHSADFLAATPRVAAALKAHEGRGVAREAVRVAESFAVRAGGIAADMWEAVPAAVAGLDEEHVLALLRHAEGFLDRGGAAALHAFASGGEVLRLAPEAFAEWARFLRAVAEESNAAMVALARTSPAFFRALAETRGQGERVAEPARRVIMAAREVASIDVEAAILCFRSGPQALRTTTVEQFERWARDGLALADASARARRSYYALETRRSNESSANERRGPRARRRGADSASLRRGADGPRRRSRAARLRAR